MQTVALHTNDPAQVLGGLNRILWSQAHGQPPFGVEPDSKYPVCSVLLELSDRLLLYTDGVTETENAAGEEFGDQQLERVVHNNRLQLASELSRQVLSELQKWGPAALNQQDDITLIVVDVLQLAPHPS